jgi:hypothetical protein
MSGPESNRRRDFTASPKTDDVSEEEAISSAGKGIAGSSEQYPTRAEPERVFDELKASEDKFRLMVDTIPTPPGAVSQMVRSSSSTGDGMTTRVSPRRTHTAGDGKQQFIKT